MPRPRASRWRVRRAGAVSSASPAAALAFPEVAFAFQREGRAVWQLPAVKSGPESGERLAALRERFRALLGDVKLLAVDFSTALTEETGPDESPSFESAQPAGGGLS